MGTVKPFRVALREEGKWLVAYFAPIDTMVDAIELGRTARSVAVIDPESFNAWQALWSEWSARMASQMLRGKGGLVSVEVEAAPEHERSGGLN